MSGYGYGKRNDPPARLIPADQPLNRVGSPAHHDSRKGQRAAGQGHIGDVSAGIIRSERSDFIIDLDGALLEVEDRQTNPVTRVRLGRLGSNPTDYGIEIYLPNGEPLFAAGGLAENSVGADQLAADSVAANHLQALHIEVGKFIRSSNFNSGSAGWAIDGNGNAEFNDVTVRGVLDGATGTYEGNLVASGGTFAGNLTAAGGTFGGTLEAVDGFFHGSLVAVSGTFSTITSGLLAGQAIVLDLDATGSSSVLEGENFVLRANGSLVLGNHLAVDTSGNITFTGTLDGVGGTFSGELQAASGTFAGDLEAASGTFSGDITIVSDDNGLVENAIIFRKDTTNRGFLQTFVDVGIEGVRLITADNLSSLDVRTRFDLTDRGQIRIDTDETIFESSSWINFDTGQVRFLNHLTEDPFMVGSSPVQFLQVQVDNQTRYIPLHSAA